MHRSLVERKKVIFLIYETKRTKRENSVHISNYFALMGEQSGRGDTSALSIELKFEQSNVSNYILLILLITQIVDILMLSLNMSLKRTPCSSLMITLITRILDTFMCRQNMSLKMTLFCSLIITLIMDYKNT